MIIEVKVPSPGESISEVQLANWLVEDGSYVEKNQDIAEIDSDKATLSISAEESGTIHIIVSKGETIEVGTVVAKIDTDVKAPAGKPVQKAAEEKPAAKVVEEKPAAKATEEKPVTTVEAPPAQAEIKTENAAVKPAEPTGPVKLHLSPLAKKLLESKNLSEEDFLEMISNYRLSREDVAFILENKDKTRMSPVIPAAGQPSPQPEGITSAWNGGRDTERRKMSTLRLKLAERLVAVKNETAMLTTFNEVNMSAIMKIRQEHKDAFNEKYGVSLGFMSFFTKAVTEALQHFPQVNAEIDSDELVFHNYADIGIAVSTPKGLMVPVLRNAEKMSLAELEVKIKELANKARDNKITLEDLKGGTFTITNGGVFGSMLSTPILNPPQCAILGMHNIVDRPVAVNGKIQIHPIMYVALSYDHRIIDGRESVSFLMKVKEILENPVDMIFGGNDPIDNLLGL